ncbi:MAG: Hpt domain-containing protein [Litoreibacter sp.]|nr:Hpt domain-containing protein [Litoreibacter sp.]
MIDWDRVSELRTDFGDEDFLEIVTMFISEVEQKLEEMNGNGFDNLSEDYHFLKGGAANLGFADLHLMCSKAEAHGDRAALGEIKETFSRSKEMFLAQTQ